MLLAAIPSGDRVRAAPHSKLFRIKKIYKSFNGWGIYINKQNFINGYIREKMII